jgi:hypothetical protein
MQFVVQWGLKGDPKIDELYQTGANIKDDPSNKSNKRGRITFATSGTDSRSTQVGDKNLPWSKLGAI